MMKEAVTSDVTRHHQTTIEPITDYQTVTYNVTGPCFIQRLDQIMYNKNSTRAGSFCSSHRDDIIRVSHNFLDAHTDTEPILKHLVSSDSNILNIDGFNYYA